MQLIEKRCDRHAGTGGRPGCDLSHLALELVDLLRNPLIADASPMLAEFADHVSRHATGEGRAFEAWMHAEAAFNHYTEARFDLCRAAVESAAHVLDPPSAGD